MQHAVAEALTAYRRSEDIDALRSTLTELIRTFPSLEIDVNDDLVATCINGIRFEIRSESELRLKDICARCMDAYGRGSMQTAFNLAGRAHAFAVTYRLTVSPLIETMAKKREAVHAKFSKPIYLTELRRFNKLKP